MSDEGVAKLVSREGRRASSATPDRDIRQKTEDRKGGKHEIRKIRSP